MPMPLTTRFVPEFRSTGVLLHRSRAGVASNNGGHKTVRLAKKKGGSSEFYCFVTFFFFETKQIKFLRVLAPFFWFLKRDFLNAIRTVLARRHRSHSSSGFTTEGRHP